MFRNLAHIPIIHIMVFCRFNRLSNIEGLSGSGEVVLNTLAENMSMHTSTSSTLESSLLAGSRINPSVAMAAETEDEPGATLLNAEELEADNG